MWQKKLIVYDDWSFIAVADACDDKIFNLRLQRPLFQINLQIADDIHKVSGLFVPADVVNCSTNAFSLELMAQCHAMLERVVLPCIMIRLGFYISSCSSPYNQFENISQLMITFLLIDNSCGKCNFHWNYYLSLNKQFKILPGF